jgi:hypothetical protein
MVSSLNRALPSVSVNSTTLVKFVMIQGFFKINSIRAL